jgi:hypothetical protein
MSQSLSRLAGKWHNQHGSELDLTVSGDGKVTGKFRSGTGLAKGEPCDAVGFATPDGLVAFTVERCGDTIRHRVGRCLAVGTGMHE